MRVLNKLANGWSSSIAMVDDPLHPLAEEGVMDAGDDSDAPPGNLNRPAESSSINNVAERLAEVDVSSDHVLY